MPVAANPSSRSRRGLMIWTLICFGITFFVLQEIRVRPDPEDHRRAPGPNPPVDRGGRHAREESRKLLEEHRELRERPRQAEDPLGGPPRRRGSVRERVREETSSPTGGAGWETRRQIEAETQRALEQIRAEVADLALVAAGKVTQKTLDHDDHRRLIGRALGLDFSALEKEQAR